MVLVVLLPPEELLRTSTAFLQKLSVILRTTLRFRLDNNGEAMIRPYTRKEARLKRELQPQQEVIGLVSLTVVKNCRLVGFCRVLRHPKCLSLCFSFSSIVYLEIDNRLCTETCFPTADTAAKYLGALSAAEMLRFPYPLKEVRGE